MKAYNLVDWGTSLTHLRAWDRNPDVEKRYVVPSESGDKAYLVREVTALKFEKEVADAVVDETKYYLCSCPHFKYRKFPEEEPEGPLRIPSCKHVRSISKVAKAENDENQTTINA